MTAPGREPKPRWPSKPHRPSRYSLFCAALGLGWYGVLILSQRALAPFHEMLGIDDPALAEMLTSAPLPMAASFAFSGWLIGKQFRKRIADWRHPPKYGFTLALVAYSAVLTAIIFGVLWYVGSAIGSGRFLDLVALTILLPYAAVFGVAAFVLHLPTVLAFSGPWMRALRWAAG
jgi:hypothetical protein